MFVVAVTFEIVPERVAAFSAAVGKQAGNSLQLETGCYVFDVCRDAANETAFFLYEKYENAAAFDEHIASEHFKSFDALVGPWIVSKTVQTWVEQEATA